MEAEESTALGSFYQAMTGEDAADWEDLVGAVVNCRVHLSAKKILHWG
jgi:hypothetical protein